MTDRELQKLNRRELLELVRAQAKSCKASEKRVEELEEENRTLRESLTRIGKTMNERRAREETVDAALAEKTAALAEKTAALSEKDAALAEKTAALSEKDAALTEKTAALAEKDAALQNMERELDEARAGQTERERLGQQVDLLFDRFRQLKPAFEEKDRQLQAAEKRIAEQERTIRTLKERIYGRG